MDADNHEIPLALGQIILETFRLNGRLLARGDELVADLGLTSARWQVLGAIALSPVAEPVARVARSMGLHRQGVQRIVDELSAERLVAFQENPHHRRAKLVTLTETGRTLYDAADRRRSVWLENLGQGLSLDSLQTTLNIISTLRLRLESEP